MFTFHLVAVADNAINNWNRWLPESCSGELGPSQCGGGGCGGCGRIGPQSSPLQGHAPQGGSCFQSFWLFRTRRHKGEKQRDKHNDIQLESWQLCTRTLSFPQWKKCVLPQKKWDTAKEKEPNYPNKQEDECDYCVNGQDHACNSRLLSYEVSGHPNVQVALCWLSGLILT